MIVFNPLSLYTTYLGWQQYDVLFDALWQTGLLYLGFLDIAYRFLKNVLAPAGSTHHAAEHALNHFLFELAMTVLICGIFVYPCVPLEAKAIQFKPLCGVKNQPATIGDTGTTYDEAFADVLTNEVKIPIGFAIIQNFMSSLTYSLMKVTGCTDSLQAIKGDLVSTYLPHEIRANALDFHKQCFIEARTLYHRETHDKNQIEALLKRYGEDDLNWMSSKILQNLYYAKLYANAPVEGFRYNDAPNPNLDNALKRGDITEAQLPENGYPSCMQWWTQLKKDLVEVSQKATIFNHHLDSYPILKRMHQYILTHPKAWHSELTAEDYIAKSLLSDSQDMQNKSVRNLMETNSNPISHSLVNAGQWLKSWTSTPFKREAIMQTLPVMQAFFMFFLIVLSPLVLALSNYSPKALGSLMALFIMGIFLQYLWHLVGFVERSVLDPLGDNNAIAAMRNMAVMFYFAAPVLLLRLSSHFGGEAGISLMALVKDSSTQSNEIANSGQAVMKAGTSLTKGFNK